MCPRDDASLWVWGCSECPEPLAEERAGKLVSCLQEEGLCKHVKMLQEEVSRLHSIRDSQKEVDQIFTKTMQLQEPQCPAVLKERQAVCIFQAGK